MAVEITWVVRLIGLSTPITEQQTGGTLQTNGSANNIIRQVISRKKSTFFTLKNLVPFNWFIVWFFRYQQKLYRPLHNVEILQWEIEDIALLPDLVLHCVEMRLSWIKVAIFCFATVQWAIKSSFFNTNNVCKKAIPSAHWSISRKLKYARNLGNRNDPFWSFHLPSSYLQRPDEQDCLAP